MHSRSTFFLITVFVLIAAHMALFEQGLGGDGWGYYATCESVLIDGDLNLNNNIYGVYNGFTKDPQTGRYITQYPPGLAVMNAPFFLIGNLIGSVADMDIPQDKIFNNPNFKDVASTTFFRIFGFVFAHNVYAMLGLILLYLTLRANGFSRNLSAVLVCLTYFASPLHYYAQSGMSHANGFFLVSLLLYLFTRYCITRQTYLWGLMGICCGLATAVRYTNGIVLVVSFFFLLYLERKNTVRALIYLGCGFAAVFWIVPAFWWLHANQLRPGYTASFFFSRIPFYNILFSPHSGFFMFHPLFVLCIPGFILYLRRTYPSPSDTPRLSALFAMCAAVPICLVYGYWGEWYGGDSYSQRYVINCLPLFILCMAPIFTLQRPWKTVVIIFAVCATVFSYAAFLVSLSRILEFPQGYIWPQHISEYRYLFTQDHTFSEFTAGLRNNILTIKALNLFF